MDFRRGRPREEPDINLVPFIDILLVIVIFLAVTTTYSKYSELQINLPTADAGKAADRPEQINIAVTATGNYVIGKTPVTFSSPDALSTELKRAAGNNDDPMVVISADAKATHQSVIRVLEAARLAGFGRITFATQNAQK
ncbi:MAG: biopolymer transporter ExbD [Burkholderiales bacterium]|jgi:biopolymer transport protein ExbD|nr:biopolymer transporter ExbD [Burkholderiales bacterium]